MIISIDLETFPITSETPFPKPVCMSWCSGLERGIIKPDKIMDFLKGIPEDDDTIIVAHNIKFDLMVMYEWMDPLFIKNWILNRLSNGTFRDTILCAKLADLAQCGDLSSNKYSLAALVKRFFNQDISDTKSAHSWRTRYQELHFLPIRQWPQEAIDYALDDAEWVYKLFDLLKQYDCQKSILADFVLANVTNKGMKIDRERVKKMTQDVTNTTEGAKRILVDRDFAKINPKDPKKLNKSLLKLREHIKNITQRGMILEKTEKGEVATDRSVLRKHAKQDEICEAFLKLSEFTKLESTYLPALANDIVRSNYNVMVETGRTSSFGSTLYPSCNLQNFPRGMGVRECLIPREGHVFVSIDYGSLELCSVAQQIYKTYGYSTHAIQINDGKEPTDLHSFLGVKIYNNYKISQDSNHVPITYKEFVQKLQEGDKEIKNFRTLAKPVGLGFPGGLGPKTMVDFALQTYGIKLNVVEATKLRDIFYDTYPDFAKFMKKDSRKYCTGRRTRDSEEEYAYTIGTRTRTGCSFTNFANGYLMQSLSADGAKQAVYDTYRYLFGKNIGDIVNFIHDEIIFEMKDTQELEAHIEALSYTMVRAMQKVMPNIRITVEASVMSERWTKDGPFRFTKKYWLDGVGI